MDVKLSISTTAFKSVKLPNSRKILSVLQSDTQNMLGAGKFVHGHQVLMVRNLGLPFFLIFILNSIIERVFLIWGPKLAQWAERSHNGIRVLPMLFLGGFSAWVLDILQWIADRNCRFPPFSYPKSNNRTGSSDFSHSNEVRSLPGGLSMAAMVELVCTKRWKHSPSSPVCMMHSDWIICNNQNHPSTSNQQGIGISGCKGVATTSLMAASLPSGISLARTTFSVLSITLKFSAGTTLFLAAKIRAPQTNYPVWDVWVDCATRHFPCSKMCSFDGTKKKGQITVLADSRSTPNIRRLSILRSSPKIKELFKNRPTLKSRGKKF